MKCSSLFSLVAMFLVLSVTACVKPSPRSADPNANFSDGTKGDVNQPAATFFNTPVKLKNVLVSKNANGISIPVEKQFTFETCIQDKRTDEKIKGHKFSVLGVENMVEVANNGRSDESGCINWTEKIAYNGAADAMYIPLKRTIVADGMHVGARDLRICVNPWDSSSDAVRDCARSPVPETQLAKSDEIANILKGHGKAGEPGGQALWINDMRLNSTYDPGGSEPGMIDFSVAMTPKILRKNVRGEEDLTPLADGNFNVRFWILAKTGSGSLNNQCIVLAKSAPNTDAKMVAGSLQEELKMKVRYLSTYGQLELVGQVQPKDESLGLAPFSGVWMLGDHTSLLGMKFAFQRPWTYKAKPGTAQAKKYLEGCIDVADGALLEKPISSIKVSQPVGGMVTVTLDKHVKGNKIVPLTGKVPADLMTEECIDGKDIPRLFPHDVVAKGFKGGTDFLSCVNEHLPSGITRLEQFELSRAVVKAQPISDPLNTETTTERTIKYQVVTRVTNPMAQGAPLRDVKFTIEKSDGTIETRGTDKDGDLIFIDKIHHSYFQPERFILKVVTISHASGFSKRLALVFNPWDNIGFTFASDIRGMTKQTIAQVNLIPRPKSELLLTQFQWGTQGFRYEVDDFLNLKIFKQFNLTLNPRVLRYSSLTEGRNKDEPLRAGIYLMKVAIQKDYQVLDGEPLEYVTAIRKLVRVRNGVINEPVEMTFRDFRILKIRTNLMIELATIDETKLTLDERLTLKVDRDLDSLIDRKSGLEARTFIGPVVAYSNGFSASMRPADDLAESVCATIDCDEIKKKEVQAIYAGMKERAGKRPESDVALASYKKLYDAIEEDIKVDEEILKEKDEKKRKEMQERTAKLRDERKKAERTEKEKFVGSIELLANKSVSDMIDRQAELERKFLEKTIAESRLSNLLREGNFEYGAVHNEPAIIKQEPILAKNNKVLQVGNGFGDLVRRMSTLDPRRSVTDNSNEPVAKIFKQMAPKPEVDVETFQNVLFAGQPMTQDLASRLCLVLIEQMILQRDQKAEEAASFGDRVRMRSKRMSLTDACVMGIFRGQVDDVVSVERKLRVFQVLGSTRRGGNLMGLNVGAGSSFGFSKGQSFSYGWSATNMVGGVFKLGSSIGSIASAVPGIGLVEKAIDATGLSISVSRSQSKSMGADTSTSTGQNLAVELRGMRVNLNQYERCGAVRLSKDFVERHFQQFRSALPDSLTLQQKLERIGRGVMLCEGSIMRKPIEVDERYYQFSQIIGDEVMNDPTALENHPYLSITVRSRGDYARFIRVIEGIPQGIESIPDHYDIGELPMVRLKAAFKTSTPAFPGVYTIEPDSMAFDQYKPNSVSQIPPGAKQRYPVGYK